MGLSETANLVAKLSLEGNFVAQTKVAEASLGRLNAATLTAGKSAGAVSSGFRSISGAATGLGGALGHAGSQLKNLVTGPLGLLGLGAGLFTIAGAIEHGIGMAQSFGDEVRRLTALTGEGAASISAMASAFEHFGVAPEAAQRSIGFLEKNVGLLASRKDGIADFQKTFSFALTDTNGKIKTANELLLTTADYFNNKSIPATEKAAAISKLYGRSWQDLIPILAAGRQGIADVEAEAAAMGLTLTQDNIIALQKLKTATRDWNTALSGLELQVGLALVPSLTDLAKAMTSFVSDHRTDIVAFFRNAATEGKKLVGIARDVIGSLSSAWNAVPPELRDFIVKGVVADRTIKFLFGFDPIAALGKGLFGGIGGQFFARGSSPANPMYVAGAGIGGVGGGAGILTMALTALTIDALVVGLGQAVADAIGATPSNPADPASRSYYRNKNSPGYTPPAHIPGGAGGSFGSSLIGRNPDHLGPDLSDDTRETRAIASFNRIGTVLTGSVAPKLSAIQQAILRFGYSPSEWAAIYARAYAAGGRSQINALARTHKALDAIALADSETSKFLTGQAGPFFRDGKNQTRLLASLDAAQKHFNLVGDTATASRLGADIAALKAKLGVAPVVNITVNTSVSVRDTGIKIRRATSYGATFGIS